ncbi:MAG: glycosyltransferase [Candidatus Caldarchaeum sp.]
MSLGGAVQTLIIACSVFSLVYLINYVYLAFISAVIHNKPRQATPLTWPSVSIHIPVYNERYVVQRIIKAVSELDYPEERLQVVVIDDSDDDTPELVKEAAERFLKPGVEFLHLRRESRQGFKGGALQEALSRTKAGFIAVFDADFIPPKDFLKKAVGCLLADDRIGAVQARWEHINRADSALTRGQALNLDLHFEVEQQARSSMAYFLNFNGTAGVWRRRCIEDSGGWRGLMAEDLELSVRAQLGGWRIVYLGDTACPGEVPPQAQAAKRQQYRWAYGAVETAKIHLPTILKSDLGLGLKIQSFLHLTRHIPQLLFLTILLITPVAILAGVPSGNALTASSWAMISAALVAGKLGPKGLREFPHMVLFTASMTLNNALAVVDALRGRRMEFHRTPKFGEGEWRGKKYVLPLDLQSYLEVALGVWLLILSFISAVKLLTGYTVYLTISGSSFLYVGLLSLNHAPKHQKTVHTREAKALSLVLVAIIAGGLVGSVYNYYQTYYRLDYASGYLMRGASSSDAAEIAAYIERALEILPSTGNPVWLFPTPRTDFSLITKDLRSLLSTAQRLSRENADSPTYQQGVDQVKDSLRNIRDQVMEAAPFNFLSLLYLPSTALWMLTIVYMAGLYGRARRQ